MTGQPDLWDDTGAFLYRNLPETSLDDFFTEERDSIRISPEGRRWWVNQDGVIGEDPYDTLSAAKAAADAEIASMAAGQDALLLAEARLDPNAWRVSYEDAVAFHEKEGDRSIAADVDDIPSGEQRWIAFRGDAIVAEGLPDVASAREALGITAHGRPGS